MIVSLVAHGHALFGETLPAFGVDADAVGIVGRLGIITEDPAHVMEQFGRCQHDGRISELVEAVEKELGVLITLGGGAGQPFLGLLTVLFHIPAKEIQLAQGVLGKLISLFSRSSQILQRLLYILWYRLAGEISLSG